MAYATIADLKLMLPQATMTDADQTVAIQLLERATGVIDGRLGFSFASWAAAVSDKDFDRTRVPSSHYLELPPYQAGSITRVYELYAKGDPSEYTEEVLSTYYDIVDDGRLYRYEGWPQTWYRVTAVWGYGPPPDEVVQVCLELTVNLWRGRDRGMWTDAIGVEGGGAVAYARALTNQQRMVLDDVRAAYLGIVIS